MSKKNRKKAPLIARKLQKQNPDREGGFSEYQLKEMLNEDEFEDFKRWMRGQTIRVEAGEAIYYADDVMRWAHGLERWRAEMPKTKSHG